MIKRTLYFGNPAYLSMRNEQLEMRLPQVEKNETLPEFVKQEAVRRVPIEDIGVVLIDHRQITITHVLISKLLENNVALITCDASHHPTGLMLNLSGNHVQTERFKHQIEASIPLKKQLWQQTITAKISNQAAMLRKKRKLNVENMLRWAKHVKSGDADNHEAQAAAYYWNRFFPENIPFRRDRYGDPPNQLLNYGYAILRAVVARGLVSSGLLPTLGIHHRNKYNHYCLADDIMEPYRPFVDEVVFDIVNSGTDYEEMHQEIKQKLLQIPAMDISIEGNQSPLMVGLQRTTASLTRCFMGLQRKIIYPCV